MYKGRNEEPLCSLCDAGRSDCLQDFDDNEFVPCVKCDDHPACEDFGCAIDLGLGRMVKKDRPLGTGDSN